MVMESFSFTEMAASSKLGGPKRARALLLNPKGSFGMPKVFAQGPIAIQIVKNPDRVHSRGQLEGARKARAGRLNGSRDDPRLRSALVTPVASKTRGSS